MNEYARAGKIREFYDLLTERGGLATLSMLIDERIGELKTVGVTPSKTQSERDVNSGRYLEISNFLNRLEKENDDARELLEQDKDNPPDSDSKTGG